MGYLTVKKASGDKHPISFKAQVIQNSSITTMDFKENNNTTIETWKRKLCEQLNVAYK